MTREPLQSLWVGDRLSTMEQLSISSFLHNGHPFHLFTYNHVEKVPDGCVIEDAREILPESRIFQYKGHASYAGFANNFRYKLLLERGGWWVDTDAICLRPFDFDAPYVFGTEADREGRDVTNNGFLKIPAGSEAMAYAVEICLSKRPEDLAWGETGPKLMHEVVTRFGLESYRQPHQVFCPIGFRDWSRLIEPEAEPDWPFGEVTRAVHLWNEMWRRGDRDKDAIYHANCIYERLKTLYL